MSAISIRVSWRRRETRLTPTARPLANECPRQWLSAAQSRSSLACASLPLIWTCADASREVTAARDMSYAELVDAGSPQQRKSPHLNARMPISRARCQQQNEYRADAEIIDGKRLPATAAA